MKITIQKVLIGIGVILLLLQFYQPARNQDYGKVQPKDIASIYHAPAEVDKILRTSCYDCHSNNTFYPWYANIQPVRMFLDNHVNEGKSKLNLSEYGSYSNRRQSHKMDEMVKEIESNEMPLSSYTIIHKNAILSESQKTLVNNWLKHKSDSISAIN